MEKITRKTLLYKSGVEYSDFTINHVLGCAHGCKYPCFAFLLKKRFGEVTDFNDWCQPKIVANALELLDREIPRLKDKIKFVHLCFATDPFMFGFDGIATLSIDIIGKLNEYGIPCSVLTKGILPAQLATFDDKNEYGITLVSLSDDFRKQFEPNAAPINERLAALKCLHDSGSKTWVSIEPYPTPNIFEQDLEELLDAVRFVDKIVFGKWNYNNAAAQYPNAENFYNTCAQEVIDFCYLHDIDCYIKKGTVSELNLFDRNGCRLKLGDTVRILANEYNIFYDLTPDDEDWLEWNSFENGIVTFDSDTNSFELACQDEPEYAYWNLNHDFTDGSTLPFLEVIKEVNHV